MTEQQDRDFEVAELRRQVDDLSRRLNALDQNGLDRFREFGVLPFGRSVELSDYGTIIRRFSGQYNLEVVSNQIVGGAGVVPAGNADMDYNNDGFINILDASYLAANLYPPGKAGFIWVDRDYRTTATPLPGSTPKPQGYIFGLSSNAPNAYVTHSVVEQMGAVSDGGHAYFKAHSAKTSALSQADLLLSGAVWQNATTLTQIAANTNNYEVGQNLQCVVRISSDAARDITGIVAPILSSEVTPSAWWMILQNVGSFNITLKDNSGSSSVGNKFALDADIVLKPDQCAFLLYDSEATVWRALAYPSASTVLTTLLLTDTAWAAAGDLPLGTGNDTATILPVGASGTRLTADVTNLTNKVAWEPFFYKYKSASSGSGSVQPYEKFVAFNLNANADHTLYGASAVGAGDAVVFKRVDSTGFTATVKAGGSDTIDGATSRTLAPLESITCVSDGGTNWMVI